MKLLFEKNLAIFSAKRVGNKNQPKNRTELLMNKNLAICPVNRICQDPQDSYFMRNIYVQNPPAASEVRRILLKT